MGYNAIGALLGAALLLWTSGVSAHPEFQTFAQKNSGRYVNCSMCHAHADGPEGVKPGQIGRLSPEELTRLNAARASFKPNEHVDSPILNAFGNEIVRTLGKERFLQMRKEPAALAPAMGFERDLDGDGIPDAREYLEGTDPLDERSGAPLRLFLINVQRYRFDVLLLLAATLLGMYGIHHLLRWLGREARSALPDEGRSGHG